MKKDADFSEIDWTHEYANCSGHTQHHGRRRRGLAALLMADALAAVLAGVLLARWLGGGFPVFLEDWLAGMGQAAEPAAWHVGADSAPPQAVYEGGWAPAERGLPPCPETSGGVVLEVAPLQQKPELPNGCEATALAMLLQYHGFAADKLDLAYSYIPRQDFGERDGSRTGPDPAWAYAGDPASRQGFYCLAGPVVQGADNYLQQQGSALRGRDISGSGPADWTAEIDAGNPLLLWVTLDLGSTATTMNFSWRLPGGDLYTPYANLHCVVLCGYDEYTFTLCDPLRGQVREARETVEDSYWALGGHAVGVGAW